MSKPKNHETIESTWKDITNGRHIPLNPTVSSLYNPNSAHVGCGSRMCPTFLGADLTVYEGRQLWSSMYSLTSRVSWALILLKTSHLLKH